MISYPRILIVKLSAFGDLCFALPTVRALKQKLPQSELHWLVDETFESFLSQFEGIDKIISVKSENLYKGGFPKKLKSIFEIRKMLQKYDSILLLHRNRSYLSLFAGKGPVTQIVREKNSLLDGFSRQVEVPSLSLHESYAIKKVVEDFLQLQIPESDWQFPKMKAELQFDGAPSGIVTLHIGGGDNKKTNFNLKKWPHFKNLIELLLGGTQETVALIGTEQDRADLRDLPKSSRLLDLCGKTKWTDLIAIAGRTKLFVGPDSGPLHLFDQLEVPSLGLFGPTSEVSWGVIGQKSQSIAHSVPCHPCYKDDGHFPTCEFEHRCMTELKAEKVFEILKQKLA